MISCCPLSITARLQLAAYDTRALSKSRKECKDTTFTHATQIIFNHIIQKAILKGGIVKITSHLSKNFKNFNFTSILGIFCVILHLNYTQIEKISDDAPRGDNNQEEI